MVVGVGVGVGFGEEGDEAQSIGSPTANAFSGAALPSPFNATVGVTAALSGRPEVTSSRDIGDSSTADAVDSQADIDVEEEIAAIGRYSQD